MQLPQKQANANARINEEKTEGGVTACAHPLGLNVNPSTAFVVLLQMLLISTCAPPPAHNESF